MEALKLIITKLLLDIYTIWAKIKWNPHNPWGMACLNLAYKKYQQSDLYRLRQAFLQEVKENDPFYYKEVKEEMDRIFIDSGEIFIFLKKVTLKEKLLIFFAPFSISGPFGLTSQTEVQE